MDSTRARDLEGRREPLTEARSAVRAFLAPETVPSEVLGERLEPIPEDTVEAMRSELGPDEERRLATAAVQLLRDAFPSDQGFEEIENWPLCAALLPHIVTATGHARELGVAHDDSAYVLVAAAAYLMAADGSKDGARALAERALDIARGAPEPAQLAVAEASSQLAYVLLKQGDAGRARPLEEEALEIRVRLLGDDHVETLMSMNNLAVILDESGDQSGGDELR